MVTTLAQCLFLFYTLGQGIQRLGDGTQEFEEKIASYLGPDLRSVGSFDTTFAAFSFGASRGGADGSCTWHDVTGTRVSPPFILAKERWVGP